MYVPATALGHSNIGQVVELTASEGGETIRVMGTLDAIIAREGGRELIVGGETWEVDDDQEVDIARSVELQNVRAMWEVLDDLDGKVEAAIRETFTDIIGRVADED